jgi:hypothetical protein
MDAQTIEPRSMMWALAEVSWADASGVANHARATIEDISASGACLRVKSPIQVGARLTVKWHREQFAAVARNCRSDGMDFLLGVRRDESSNSFISASASRSREMVSATRAADLAPPEQPPEENSHFPQNRPEVEHCVRALDRLEDKKLSRLDSPLIRAAPEPHAPNSSQVRPSPRERNLMQPKKILPNFWRRPQEADAAEKNLEVPVNRPEQQRHAAEPDGAARSELLSYEDIYHAAGIMTPRSGYGIHKVVDMLNNDRIRELSNDVKRASVLMALDAAGASVEELLQDARQRQQALDSYEERQRKQLEEFEARKGEDNTRIQAEMERVTAHYAERIQHNREEVAREKEMLHNWQMAKQNESQRISEVIELCGEKAAAGAMAAAQSGDGARSAGLRPTVLPQLPGRG